METKDTKRLHLINEDERRIWDRARKKAALCFSVFPEEIADYAVQVHRSKKAARSG